LAVKQFLSIAKINIEDQLIVWMTGFKRYVATFAEFAHANNLDYDVISNGVDLYAEEQFEDYIQYYEFARLGPQEIWRNFRAEAPSCCYQ
jgi:hypothetical protein